MELKDRIKEVVDFLKKQGHDRAAIEKKLGYGANYIDQALVRPTEKVYLSLVLYKEWVLCNTTTGSNGKRFVLPEGYKIYQANFDRLASLAEKNADTVNKMSEAHLIMTRTISSSVPGGASSSSDQITPLVPDATEDMQDKPGTGSGKKKGKQRGTSEN